MDMNTAQPIRSTEDLNNFKKYYKEVRPSKRNLLLIVMGLNTALRISDILGLKWEDVYDFHRCEYGEVVIDQDTWSTEPLTQNGKELVDLGYTIATVYVDYSFYGKLEGSTTAPTVLIGSPRYLMTFAIENDQWLLVEQINVKDRWDERQDALL